MADKLNKDELIDKISLQAAKTGNASNLSKKLKAETETSPEKPKAPDEKKKPEEKTVNNDNKTKTGNPEIKKEKEEKDTKTKNKEKINEPTKDREKLKYDVENGMESTIKDNIKYIKENKRTDDFKPAAPKKNNKDKGEVPKIVKETTEKAQKEAQKAKKAQTKENKKEKTNNRRGLDNKIQARSITPELVSKINNRIKGANIYNQFGPGYKQPSQFLRPPTLTGQQNGQQLINFTPPQINSPLVQQGPELKKDDYRQDSSSSGGGGEPADKESRTEKQGPIKIEGTLKLIGGDRAELSGIDVGSIPNLA